MLSFRLKKRKITVGSAGSSWFRLKGDEISGALQQLLISLIYSNSPPLQAVCELSLIQAVLQRLQAHRGAGGAGEERPAQEACPQSHECHQHTGGEP